MRSATFTVLTLGLCGCTFFHEATRYRDPAKEAAIEQDKRQAQWLAIIEHGKPVRIEKADPPLNYKELGPISAFDGGGDIGGRGTQGTYDRAIVALKAKAVQMGADYVQLMAAQPPHVEPNFLMTLGTQPDVFVYTYVVSGIAYRAP